MSRVALALIGIGLAGCGSSSGAKASGTAPQPVNSAAPAAPSFDCGTVVPNTSVVCTDGVPVKTTQMADTSPQSLAPDAPVTSSLRIDGCDLGTTPGDAGKTIAVSLTASCTDAASDASTAAFDVILDVDAARRCAPGPRGSSASASPYWEASLALPGDSSTQYRIDVTADASGTPDDTGLTFGCALSVGGVVGDTFSGGDGQPVFDGFVPATDSLPIVLDCASTTGGLASDGCFGYSPPMPVSPPELTRHVALHVRATRCDANGCSLH